MKIIILHGDDFIKSLSRLDLFIAEAKKREWDIQKIDLKSKISLPEVVKGELLFSEERLLVIHNASLLKTNDYVWLKQNEKLKGKTLVFHENKSLSSTALKKFPSNSKSEEFKIKKEIWDFLNSFYPGNSKIVLHLKNNLNNNREPIELTMYLLSRHLKDICLAKNDPMKLNYPSWRINKLKNQASRFSGEKLNNIISELAKIDIKSKTSKHRVEELLDLLIMLHLE